MSGTGPRLLIFTIHGTTRWWQHIAAQLDFASRCTVLSDLRGGGDVLVVDRFYHHLQRGDAQGAALAAFGAATCDDIILRCRTLRSLDRSLALRMIGAMHAALDEVVAAERPDLVLSFTIDRYVMDVLERVARRRGAPFLEMTVSIVPGQVLLMQRGRLTDLREPGEEEVSDALALVDTADFAPSYVQNLGKFGMLRYWQVFAYYELRGAAFNAIRWLRRDPLNLHYLDARKVLRHKVRFGDWRVLRMLHRDWRERLVRVPSERRVFLGLQLFPEASMDYWLDRPELLRHDEVILRICRVLGAAGYHLFVKDHPQQFGFRQRELFEALSRLGTVTLVPYEVPGALLVHDCAISVTMTGTLGFQAALAGRCSIVSNAYYASGGGPFINFRSLADIDELPRRIAQFRPPSGSVVAKRHIMRTLLRSSLVGDYFSFRGFDPARPDRVARLDGLIASLNAALPAFIRSQPMAERPRPPARGRA
jgi:hypothetical protein